MIAGAEKCGMGNIYHGYIPAAKTLFTLVSRYPCCYMVPEVIGYPIGDTILFRRFLEVDRPGPERARTILGRSCDETLQEKESATKEVGLQFLPHDQ